MRRRRIRDAICDFQEEELRQSGEAKYHHLNEDLHVLIEVFAPPAEAYARMGHALEEIKKFLIPVCKHTPVTLVCKYSFDPLEKFNLSTFVGG